MFTRLFTGSVFLATLISLTHVTPAQAQRRETRIYAYPSDSITAPPTARIHVRVGDPETEIWLNESATRQRGHDRWFETPPLADSGGKYEIRAIWMNSAGEMMDQIQEIEVGPGLEMFVDFTDESK